LVGALSKPFFRYFEHPVLLTPEKALEGHYVIQTEQLDLSAVQAVEAYKDLSEVKCSFRELKDLIEMGPIYHDRLSSRTCSQSRFRCPWGSCFWLCLLFMSFGLFAPLT